MKIVLTRDLTGPKAVAHGFIAGAAFDWPRSVISSITAQEAEAGNTEDWFAFSSEIERSMRRVSAKNGHGEAPVETQTEAKPKAPKTTKKPTLAEKATAAVNGA